MDWFRRLLKAREGSVIAISALALVSLLGMTGLAVEIGNGFAAKVRNQRVADVAALAAAIAYKTSQLLAVAQNTANDVVVANGLSITPIVSQVSVGGVDGIQVSITTAVPIRIASVLTSAASYNVTTIAVASLLTTNTTGCITALSNSSTAVSASGGASISASGCALVTNGTIVSDNSSAKVTAKSITAQAINDPAAAYNQNAVTTTPTARNWTLKANGASDFVKPNTAAQTALCYVNKLTGYSDPDYAGGNTGCTSPLVVPAALSNNSTTDWSTGYTPRNQGGISNYENSDYSCTYTIPAGTYTIRDLSIGGGCSVVFATGSTLTFRNLNMSGQALTFGDGDIGITGTFTVNGNTIVTMGNGAHSFGTLAIGGGKFLQMGSGNFLVVGGINVSGGAWLKVGTSTNDTVTIGNDGAGNAIVVGGGSKVCFTSDCSTPTAAAGTFSANGSVNVQGGGSLVVFPKSILHVINGDLIATAGVIFGSGLYIIKGNFQNTTGSGSDSMNGVDVTFAMGGTLNFAGGSQFDLAAPSTSNGYGIQDILFLTKTTSGTSISAGAVGKASGLIYAPYSNFSSSGGSSISSNGSACMMLVVNTITVTGSGTVNTAGCSSQAPGATTGTVRLLQ
ncbi:pilus assembly protein TadG-related protein [Sphingomonas sp. MMS24-J13]|uniref:pilus assembly protein TadG-related protein n=1 Tax=Sphingomonas sp. MMS24-J13 TaxID=3238686 RepID=UPI00384A6186